MRVLDFRLATVEDDAALRARMKEDVLPGDIAVSFRREPSFFYGSAVQGNAAQIIKCLDMHSGKLVGLGSRILTRVYLNGKVRRAGYLADLRVHAEYRRGTMLARGYRYLRQLHINNPVPLYYSMILEENHLARNMLTSARCGLPCYQDIGRFLTPAVYLDFPKSTIKMEGVSFRLANHGDLESLFSFIQRCASEKQLAPVLEIGDFGTERLRGLNVNDFYLAVRDNEIIGAIAAWDQRAFRQTYVEKYNRTLGLMRPFYNSISRFTALKPLPAPGQHVPYFYLAFVSIKNNDPEILRGLLRYLYNHRRAGPWNYFIAGLHERDPLSRVLFEYRCIKVSGRLYLVHYPENQAEYEQLDHRIPYVEIAMI